MKRVTPLLTIEGGTEGGLKKGATRGYWCNARLKCGFCCNDSFLLQRADVKETDRDLEGTGLSRPKRSKKATDEPTEPPEKPSDEPPPSGDKSLDTEELMDSAQSVKPKERSTLYEDLHGQSNFFFLN